MKTLLKHSTVLGALALGLALSLAMSACASSKQETKQETQQENKQAAAGVPSMKQEPFKQVTPPEPTILPSDLDVDKPDSTGIVRGRYYGEELNMILGRAVRWCVENNWAILNDGAGANGTVVARGKIRGFQKVTGTPEIGQKAAYLCADCGSDAKGQIISEEGTMVVKVKTLALGKTKVTVDFTPSSPPTLPNVKCKTTGKFEQIILNYLLHD